MVNHLSSIYGRNNDNIHKFKISKFNKDLTQKLNQSLSYIDLNSLVSGFKKTTLIFEIEPGLDNYRLSFENLKGDYNGVSINLLE